jgi:hypothetical protein
VPRDTVQYTLVSAAEKRALLVGMIRVDSVEYEEGKLLLINSYYNEDAAAAAHSPVLRALAVSKQTRPWLMATLARSLDYTASHVRWRRAGTGRLARLCGLDFSLQPFMVKVPLILQGSVALSSRGLVEDKPASAAPVHAPYYTVAKVRPSSLSLGQTTVIVSQRGSFVPTAAPGCGGPRCARPQPFSSACSEAKIAFAMVTSRAMREAVTHPGREWSRHCVFLSCRFRVGGSKR